MKFNEKEKAERKRVGRIADEAAELLGMADQYALTWVFDAAPRATTRWTRTA